MISNFNGSRDLGQRYLPCSEPFVQDEALVEQIVARASIFG